MSVNDKLGKVAVLVLVSFLIIMATGCSIRTEIIIGDLVKVSGYVTISDTGIPMMTKVYFNGQRSAIFLTNRDGYYSGMVKKGSYDVAVVGLHNYGTTTYIDIDEMTNINLHVNPDWFDKQLFYGISGLYDYYYDNGQINYRIGEIAHWEQDRVRVYFDSLSIPSGYFDDLDDWSDHLYPRVVVEETLYKGLADVEVYFVQNLSGNQVGWASFLAYHENGALRKVKIEIVEQYKSMAGLWEHLLAEAMGAHHLPDTSSVMHPAIYSYQRTNLNQAEWNHIKLLYYVPSGLRLSYGIGSLSVDENESQTLVSQSSYTGYRGYVITEEGTQTELTPVEVMEIMNQGWL
jgi:hypothetical protein